MQHPLDLGAAAAHYFPADPFVDHRSHRYRSFMIEEILTDHPDAKSAAPAGELLKFGVKALLATRPYHNPLGRSVFACTGSPSWGTRVCVSARACVCPWTGGGKDQVFLEGGAKAEINPWSRMGLLTGHEGKNIRPPRPLSHRPSSHSALKSLILAPIDLERNCGSLLPPASPPHVACLWGVAPSLPSLQLETEAALFSGALRLNWEGWLQLRSLKFTCELGLGETRGSLVPCWDGGPGNTPCDFF